MPPNAAPFVRKTYEIVSDPSTNAIVCWSPSGDSFLILQEHLFQKEILPKYFKHDNLCSFIRQLNTYGFRKVSGPKDGGESYLEFEQPDFQKDKPERLKFLKRKQKSSKRSPKEGYPEDSAADVNEIVADRNRMANTLNTLIKQQQETEKTLKALWGELAEAKKVVADLESRKRPRTDCISQPIPDNKRVKDENLVALETPGIPLAEVAPPERMSSDNESESDMKSAARLAGLSAHMLHRARFSTQ